MSATDCYLDSAGCVVCPEIAPTPAVPGSTSVSANTGWNAGANSIAVIGGDVHVVDNCVTAPAGIMLGFKTTRTFNTDPTLPLHGLYLYTVGGQSFIEVWELGAKLGATQNYALGTNYEIRRIGSEVSYWLGSSLLMKTKARTLAPVLVNACLYAAGDTV